MENEKLCHVKKINMSSELFKSLLNLMNVIGQQVDSRFFPIIFIKNRKCKHRKFLFQFGGSFSTVFFSFLQNPLVGYFNSSPQDIDVCLGTIKDKYHLIMLVRTNW